MTIFNLLSLFGGLALFLYGMHLMSTSLESMSGGVLERAQPGGQRFAVARVLRH